MHLYILKSSKSDRYYIGITDDLQRRLEQHNQPTLNPSRWSRAAARWSLVFRKQFDTSREARRAESYLKKMKSRVFIEKLIRGEYKLPDFSC